MPLKYKKFKRIARRGLRNVRRRYYRKNKGVNVMQIMKDVKTIRSMLNSEKKNKNFAPTTVYNVGQIYADSSSVLSGHQVVELTATDYVPASGASQNQRTGASIRVCSHILRMQFWHQTTTAGPRSLQIYIIRTMGDANFAINEFLNQNTFIANSGGVNTYDTNSRRNQDFYKQFRVIARKSLYIKNDETSGELVVKNLTIPLKFKTGNHIKFIGDTQTVSDGRTFLLILANAGNSGPNTPSGYGYIPTKTHSTGINFSFTNDYYYYDN